MGGICQDRWEMIHFQPGQLEANGQGDEYPATQTTGA